MAIMLAQPATGFIATSPASATLHTVGAAPLLTFAKPRMPLPLLSAAASSDGSSSSSSSSNEVKVTVKKPPSPTRLQKLVRQVQNRAGPATRKARAILFRLRPLIPFILVFAIMIASGMRRAAAVPKPVEMTYAAFMKLVESRGASSISDMRISLTRISFLLDGKAAFTRPVRAPQELLWFLHKHGVDYRAAATSAAATLLPLLFPCIWLLAVYSLMKKQMGGSTGNVGKKASSLRLSADDLTFDDIAGIDTAKGEVQEIVTMLQDPGRYKAAGARLPSGVLMVGPPGTGKTLLARVMAAQAEVPFFYCSGSDFVELFVGRGAARMRALFKEAAESSPCLIFVDELDALGKQRSLRLTGSNDEVEQTLNQMLACMDGVDSSNNGVVSRRGVSAARVRRARVRGEIELCGP